MLKKLAVCFFVIACALVLSACGGFSPDTDYNTDLKAREKLLEEIVKLYDAQIDYGGKDTITLVESEFGIHVERFVIHTPESAEMLFNCVRNAQAVYDLTGVPIKPEPLPVYINEGDPIGSFDHVYIDFPPTEQFFRISFTDEDAQAFYDHALTLGTAFLPREILENGGMMETMKGEFLSYLESEIVYAENDELTMCYDREKRYIERAEILTPESAELLFDCVKTCWSFSDVTGLDLGDEHMPLVINGKAIGNFKYLYLDYPPTDSRVAIELDWQYAEALYDHLFAQGSDELNRDVWGNIMPPTKTGERLP